MREAVAGPRTPRRNLSAESFEALLRVLDADRDLAGARYEGIRVRLLRFFLWRGSTASEELADETFDRVCRKIEEGESIRPADAERYFLGVARNILREAWDRDRRRTATHERLRRAEPPSFSGPVREDDRALVSLKRCLEALPPETRELVLLYYESDGGEKIAQRKALAERFGVAVNALRIRLHRVRTRLEECVRAGREHEK